VAKPVAKLAAPVVPAVRQAAQPAQPTAKRVMAVVKPVAKRAAPAAHADAQGQQAALTAEILAVLRRAPKAMPADRAQATPETAADDKPAADAKPIELVGLQALLALSVAEGLFLIAAAGASLEAVQAFARYETEPLPRFVSEPGYFSAQATQAGPVVYTAFVPWPGVPAGALQLGCITASARKPLLTVNTLALADLQPEDRAALLARFGRVLLPAALAMLPATHALRQALQPAQPAAPQPVPSQTTVRCHFDGVIDGLAHGWVYDPAQPGKAFTVEVLHQGDAVSRGLADRYRDDLERNGFGDGCHHFRLALSYTLFDGQPHVLSVRVVELGAAELCPPLTCTLEASQPVHLDTIPRAQTLVLAQQLGRSAKVSHANAEQALLQAFRQCGLQQETWLLEAARAGYVRLAEVLGANALCHCKIAETWLLEHQLARALEAYSAAVQLDPQLPWAQLGLGNVLRLQGRALEARDAYRAALACAPGLAVAQHRLASVQADAFAASAAQRVQAGDKAGAIALLRAAVFEQPDHEAACNSLDALLREPQPRQHGGNGGWSDPADQTDRARRLLDAMLDEAEQRLAGGLVQGGAR
jgi:tetratricopeptide (TPR) repeat protein